MEETGSILGWPRLRRPVRREGAERHLLLMLLSFAASVSLTRLFLELAGYPQIGGGGLHIAHVLWGGLLLFGAALLPLVFANRWMFSAAAVLAGMGVGLFIDEVGKFITQTNDYFFPAAAPIIYAFFLLTVLAYLQVRRKPSRDVRAELFGALDGLEEWLDHDLDRRERSELSERLTWIAGQTGDQASARLAGALLEFLRAEAGVAGPARPSSLERWMRAVVARLRRWASERRLRAVCVGALISLGLLSLKNPAQALLAGALPGVAQFLKSLAAGRQGVLDPSSAWYVSRVSLEIAGGILLLVGGTLMAARSRRVGAGLGYAGLLLSLVAVDVLVFYFEQFSTIVTTGVQLAALVAVSEYRRRYTAQETPG